MVKQKAESRVNRIRNLVRLSAKIDSGGQDNINLPGKTNETFNDNHDTEYAVVNIEFLPRNK